MKLTPVASVLAMVALAVATGAATASSGRPLLLAGTHTPAYKPASFCPANHSCFTRARWTRWGATARATAHGTTEYPDGPTHSGQAVVILSAPRHVCGHFLYTRAKWRYPKLNFPSGGQWISDSMYTTSGLCGGWPGA